MESSLGEGGDNVAKLIRALRESVYQEDCPFPACGLGKAFNVVKADFWIRLAEPDLVVAPKWGFHVGENGKVTYM